MPTFTSVKKDLRFRAFIILLVPIAVFIFMGGWLLCWMGNQLDRESIQTTLKKTTVTEGGATDECVEVGLIEDLMEEQLENI